MTRYADRKDKIREVLVQRAEDGKTIFYSELGALVGIPAPGPWKPVLDEISLEERAAKRPDITYLVINRASGLPGQIEFEAAKPPTAEQRAKADEEIRSVFEYYK